MRYHELSSQTAPQIPLRSYSFTVSRLGHSFKAATSSRAFTKKSASNYFSHL